MAKALSGLAPKSVAGRFPFEAAIVVSTEPPCVARLELLLEESHDLRAELRILDQEAVLRIDSQSPWREVECTDIESPAVHDDGLGMKGERLGDDGIRVDEVRIRGVVTHFVDFDPGVEEWLAPAFVLAVDDTVVVRREGIRQHTHANPPLGEGTECFDLTEIDLTTIQLLRADGVGGSVAPNEGPPGPHSEFEDAATPFDGQPCDCHELEGDGIADLSMKFKTDNVVAALQLNDLPAGDLVELVVSGALLDGTAFSASDCIRLVPPGTPPGMLAVGSNLPGAWLDVSLLDLQLDGGGFANFERTYPLTTVVTLTAPQMHHGWRFAGWRIGLAGSFHDGGLQPGPSIELTIRGDLHQIEAIYRPAVLDALHEH